MRRTGGGSRSSPRGVAVQNGLGEGVTATELTTASGGDPRRKTSTDGEAELLGRGLGVEEDEEGETELVDATARRGEHGGRANPRP